MPRGLPVFRRKPSRGGKSGLAPARRLRQAVEVSSQDHVAGDASVYRRQSPTSATSPDASASPALPQATAEKAAVIASAWAAAPPGSP